MNLKSHGIYLLRLCLSTLRFGRDKTEVYQTSCPPRQARTHKSRKIYRGITTFTISSQCLTHFSLERTKVVIIYQRILSFQHLTTLFHVSQQIQQIFNLSRFSKEESLDIVRSQFTHTVQILLCLYTFNTDLKVDVMNHINHMP